MRYLTNAWHGTLGILLIIIANMVFGLLYIISFGRFDIGFHTYQLLLILDRKLPLYNAFEWKYRDEYWFQ